MNAWSFVHQLHLCIMVFVFCQKYLLALGGPHVGPIDFAISDKWRVIQQVKQCYWCQCFLNGVWACKMSLFLFIFFLSTLETCSVFQLRWTTVDTTGSYFDVGHVSHHPLDVWLPKSGNQVVPLLSSTNRWDVKNWEHETVILHSSFVSFTNVRPSVTNTLSS